MINISPGFPQLRRLFESLMHRDSVTFDARATSPTIEAGTSIMNQHVNRRNVFATTAAAAGAVVALDQATANTAQKETPIEKVHRLARELSKAMDNWMEDIGGATDEYVAEIFPSKAREFPIGFRHNLGGWSPDEELVNLADAFKAAEVRWQQVRDECESILADFEERNGDPTHRFPTESFPEYWERRRVECDPLINDAAAAAEICDGIRNRLHAIPAKTIAGIAAKSQTLRFDTSLYPEDPETPMNEWNWDVECLHKFIEEASAMAVAFDARFEHVFTTGLIPTGRGSYVPAGSIALAELLRRYDMAPDHTMSREEVKAAYAA